jgi:CRISPR-associated protein Csx16
MGGSGVTSVSPCSMACLRVASHTERALRYTGWEASLRTPRTAGCSGSSSPISHRPVRANGPASAPQGVTYFVTRHAGARDWVEEQDIRVDRLVEHLDVETIGPGDTVIGSLPVNLAARLCERGGRYLHLSLEVPPDLRGKELTAEDMRSLGARVEEYRVEVTGPP